MPCAPVPRWMTPNAAMAWFAPPAPRPPAAAPVAAPVAAARTSRVHGPYMALRRPTGPAATGGPGAMAAWSQGMAALMMAPMLAGLAVTAAMLGANRPGGE